MDTNDMYVVLKGPVYVTQKNPDGSIYQINSPIQMARERENLELAELDAIISASSSSRSDRKSSSHDIISEQESVSMTISESTVKRPKKI